MALFRRAGTPFWWYDFTVNGRRFRGSTGRTGKREALGVEEARRAEAKTRVPVEGRWRVSTLTGTYWAQRGQEHAAHATTWYQLEKLNDGLGETKFIADLDGAAISEYRAKRRGDGLSPSSVNRELTLLRAMLRFA